ncbi:cytochrome c [Noviherbaspirillum cavernae]|uniref:Cytochrome c n=1 Tax=Noviherbaspirillum cavernae TaxID=2320862 RepID=A0A418WZC4_9BURK|nr:cytochrome c [Noviherbaspirillum cavernae]RJG05552.1 cytochrome c [Noviherbaspirillum cavernae]
MKKRYRIPIIAVASIALLVGIAAAAAKIVSDKKMHRVVQVEIAPLAHAAGAATVERGRYLFQSRGCADCHGASGQGSVFIDDPNGLYVKAPDITPAPDSVVAAYAERDWVRTVRHGVKPNGKPALIMPSEDYNRMTDADMASLIAYLRSMPPATGDAGEVRLPLIVRALYAVGEVRDAAEKINHALPPSRPVAKAVTVEHGAYVANMCIGCHGDGLTGGKIPGSPPDWPPATDLTPGPRGAMVRYDSADKFTVMIRTGKRPDGSAVSKVMPFNSLKELDDTDVGALHLFLKSLPARPDGKS